MIHLLIRFNVVVNLTLLASCATGSAEQRANHLFVEAARLVAQADEAESFREALRLYDLAFEHLGQISRRYPSTVVAAELARGDARFGGVSVSEIRTRIYPQTRRRVDAAQSPANAAAFIRTLPRAPDGARTRMEIAVGLAAAGEWTEAVALARSISDSRYGAEALAKTAKRRSARDGCASTAALLAEAEKLALQAPGFAAWGAIADTYVLCGRTSELGHVAARTSNGRGLDKGSQRQVIEIAARDLAARGHRAQAERLIAYWDDERRHDLGASIRKAVASVYADSGDTEAAKRLLREGAGRFYFSLADAVDVALRMGDVRLAQHLIAHGEAVYQTAARVRQARWLARKGRLNEAHALGPGFGDKDWPQQLHEEWVLGRLIAGDAAPLETSADRIDARDRIGLYASGGVVLAIDGQHEAARRLLRHAREAAESERCSECNYFLAWGWLEAQVPDQALLAVEGYMSVIEAAAEAGSFAAAINGLCVVSDLLEMADAQPTPAIRRSLERVVRLAILSSERQATL
jgi:hypothetical protein